ncbi:MAG: molybdate ABC transporter substrate-binding protein [Chloroflexota bacterium]|nr:molybdate ABC transporter substrate-binding protein [Chloroflexota bacterium]
MPQIGRLTLAAAVLVAGASIIASACGGKAQSGGAGTPGAGLRSGTLTVFAAASLTDAFHAEATAFRQAHPGIDITFNFAGSPTLRTQLAQGARADVLATADMANMQEALKAGVVRDAGVAFARNRLTIIVPKSNPAKIETPADLAKPGVKLVLAANGVPVGTYARQAIAKMAADPAFGADFAKRVLANVVSDESDVKAVVAKVQLGEADAGIVYTSDVTKAIMPDVFMVAIPDAYNVIADYPVAITKGAKRPDAAQAFIDFLLSVNGQAILALNGLTPVASSH